MTTPNTDPTPPSSRTPLVAVLALVAALSGCSHPDGLHVGPYELGFEEVVQAEADLRASFPIEGSGNLRSHLMMFGLGEAAILHQTLRKESALALLVAEGWVDRLLQGEPFLEIQKTWALESGLEAGPDAPQQPSPSGLGASVAAAVAGLENGQWAGPLKTVFGWEVVYLDQRLPGPRNRAQVLLYRLQAPVGTLSDRLQVRQDWDTLALSGNPQLIQALPLSFRHDRTLPEPE